MTQEQFEDKKSKITDLELIEMAEKEVSQLARTYGKSHKMSVPPMVTDTDIIFSELIKRFKNKL